MTDINLNPINSGYNLSKINVNFNSIEDAINNEILHLTGGNNIMAQAIDMNSNRILNLPKAVSASEPLINSQLTELAGTDTGSATNIIYTDPDGTAWQVDDVLDDLQSHRDTYTATVGLSQIGTLNLSTYSYAVFQYFDTEGDGLCGTFTKDNTLTSGYVEDSASNKWACYQTTYANIGTSEVSTKDLSGYRRIHFPYWSTARDGGKGIYELDAADSTTASNIGTVLVDSTGNRLKRNFEGDVQATWFGLVANGSTDDAANLQKALDTKRNVAIRGGHYYVGSTLAPHKLQVVYGEGGPQRGYINEPAITKLTFATDTTAFDATTNVALGLQLKRMAIIAEDQTNGSGKYGIRFGEKGTAGGVSQVIKCKAEDLFVRGFDICYGVYGWAWEVTLERCFADYPRTIGIDAAGSGVTMLDFTQTSVLLAGFPYGTALTNSAARAYEIDDAQVYMYTPRAENSQSSGFVLKNDAKVVINSIYCEGNRAQDFTLDATFDGQVMVYGGRMLHDNDGVTTWACIRNNSTHKCYGKFEGIEYALGLTNNNQTTAGFYYSESVNPHVEVLGLKILGDVSKMHPGNCKVVYLSQGGRYAPVKFTLADTPSATYYRSGTTHCARVEGGTPSDLLISDGTNTFDMLTDNSTALFNGSLYSYDSGTTSWTLIA